jgi:hypothetical protein
MRQLAQWEFATSYPNTPPDAVLATYPNLPARFARTASSPLRMPSFAGMVTTRSAPAVRSVQADQHRRVSVPREDVDFHGAGIGMNRLVADESAPNAVPLLEGLPELVPLAHVPALPALTSHAVPRRA